MFCNCPSTILDLIIVYGEHGSPNVRVPSSSKLFMADLNEFNVGSDGMEISLPGSFDVDRLECCA